MSKMPQIPVRLSAKEADQFKTYAKGAGLRISDAVKLLVLRERRLGRLKAQSGSETGSQPTNPPGKRSSIITAYLGAKGLEEFERYANRCGIERTEGVAWLIRTELKERWIERALNLQ